MAQKDIALMGAVYPDVPAVTLPIDGGGTAKFTDVSDTTASASDVAQGKYFYTAAGVLTEGTASGGGGGAAVITDTTDTHGGTIRTITTEEEYYIQQSKTVTPSSSQQVVTPDTGYDALGSVTVNAVASGSVSASASKGAVSNHSVSVTPSATKTAGLITSGTVTGTAVTITASELASGNKAITENGTNIDVIGYSTVSVNVAGGGGGGSLDDDVVFIDYDGTVLHSYSASDFANLTAMPANPSHTGLTAQGWNWTLSDAKAQVTAMGRCVIGQMYATSDRKTRIYIHLGEERKSPMLSVCPNGTVDVDWGDGTTHDTLTGTSLTTPVFTPNHEYAHGGDYVIKLDVTSGSAAIVGVSSSNQYCLLLHYASTANVQNNYYINAINRVEIGSGISIGDRAFYMARGIKSITIPTGITSLGQYVCYGSDVLSSLTLPNTLTSIGNNAFGCKGLVSFSIPKETTSIGANVFDSCYPLVGLAIPSTIASSTMTYAFRNCYSLRVPAFPGTGVGIGDYAFQNCYSLTDFEIKSGVTSIGSYAFSNCFNLRSITIPNGPTYIGNSTFSSCWLLTSLTIPSTITSIGTNAFQSCYGITEYHFLRSTPPTLSATSAFSGIQSDCKIYVPYSADHSILEAYQTANIWSTYASYMVEEAQ